MRKIILLLVCFAFLGCPMPEPPQRSSYKPIILKRADFEKSISLEGSKQVEKSAKVYIFDKLIFVNDKHKGFHIFNNSTPSNPVKEKFLKIPGATDIAIRNNTFYINQATDLIVLTFNFSDHTYKLEKRIKNVFPQMLSPDGDRYYDLKEDEVIVNWVLR